MGAALRLLAFLLTLCLPALAAAAQRPREATRENDVNTQAARVHLQAGVIYFNAGKYAEAQREMAEAYQLRPVPQLQFNLAVCYERLGELQRALDAYQRYLDGVPQAPDRAEVEARIAALREQLRTAQAAPPAAEPAPAAVPAAAPPPREKVVFKEIIVYREPPPKAGRGPRIAAAALGGLALVGLAAGIGFLSASARLNRNIEEQGQKSVLLNPAPPGTCDAVRARPMPAPGSAEADIVRHMGEQEICNYFDLTVQARNAAFVAAAAGYVVFAAAGGTALGLFLYGRRLDKRQAEELRRQGQQVTLLPALQPGGGGLVLSGTF